jgi:chemotaxis regulatin CheY-phosphate phosphatase CheZ
MTDTTKQDALQDLQDLIDAERAALVEGKGDVSQAIRRIEDAISDVRDSLDYDVGPKIQAALASLRAAPTMDRIVTVLEWGNDK